MKIVQHRVNDLEKLRKTHTNFGCEIDLRNHGADIHVTHDPFKEDGPLLEEWLQYFDHEFLILNVKEEGLEEQLFELMANNGINDYFILDETIPYIQKYALLGKSGFALRVSEIEANESAILLQSWLKSRGRSVDWIWADTFSGEPLEAEVYKKLQDSGFKICQVSPELHHLEGQSQWQGLVDKFSERLVSQGIHLDMICTKMPDYWKLFASTLKTETRATK
jgi:hypothetical protein